MKKLFNLIASSAIMLALVYVIVSFASQAMAQVAASTPAPASWNDVLLGTLALVKSWKGLGLMAGIATALKLVIDGLKLMGLFDKIPAKLQALAVAGVAMFTVGLGVLASGGTIVEASAATFGSASASMFAHELIKDIFFTKNGPKPITTGTDTAPVQKVG